MPDRVHAATEESQRAARVRGRITVAPRPSASTHATASRYGMTAEALVSTSPTVWSAEHVAATTS